VIVALRRGLQFLAVLLVFFGCIWVSLFALNSSALFIALVIVAVVGAILLLNNQKNPSISGQPTPPDTSTTRSPIAAALITGVVAVVGLALFFLLALSGCFGGTLA
jgi:uncharacterized membrane-anchored protein YitT (DUF2179 family)